MTKDEIKTAALAILAGGANWTQQATARNSDDVPVPACNDEAVKWDLHGSILKALGYEKDYAGYQELLAEMYSKIAPGTAKGNIDIDLYNDQHTWAEVALLLA